MTGPPGPAGSAVESSAAEVAAACAAAGAAFRAEQARRSFDDAALLDRLAAACEAAGPELVAVAAAEAGLSPVRLERELVRTVGQLRSHAALVGSFLLLEPIIDTAAPDAVPPRVDQRRVNVPVGPVAVLAASNFPFAFGILGGDTASALAAGCPVVVKAHPAQPGLGRVLADLVGAALAAVGAPPAWLSVVSGAGPEVGLALARHPAVQAVGFTGSFAGGTALLAAAAARPQPIPVYAEMGSLNPVFVGPTAARSRARAIGSDWAATLVADAGQLCTKPGLLVLPDGASARAAAEGARATVEGAEAMPMLTGAMRDRFAAAAAAAATTPGARWVRQPGPAGGPGPVQEAGVIEADADTVLGAPHLWDEIFGPAGIVVAATASSGPGRLAEAMPGSLTATVHVDPGDEAWAAALLVILRQRAGRLVVNGWPTGVSVGWATVHGGPWPAASAPHGTSVGFTAGRRFLRPVAYQGAPDALLPDLLRDANPRGALRVVDGEPTDRPLGRPA